MGFCLHCQTEMSTRILFCTQEHYEWGPLTWATEICGYCEQEFRESEDVKSGEIKLHTGTAGDMADSEVSDVREAV